MWHFIRFVSLIVYAVDALTSGCVATFDTATHNVWLADDLANRQRTSWNTTDKTSNSCMMYSQYNMDI